MWDFGDGSKAGGPSISHTYRTPGTYTATVTVTDLGGMTATAAIEIRVTGPTGRVAPPAGSQGDVAGESAESGALLKAPKAQRVGRGLRLRVACAEGCTVRAVLRHGGKRIGTSKTLRIRDDRRHTLTVRLSGKARRDLRAVLRRTDARSLKVAVILRVRTADGESAIRRVVRLNR